MFIIDSNSIKCIHYTRRELVTAVFFPHWQNVTLVIYIYAATLLTLLRYLRNSFFSLFAVEYFFPCCDARHVHEFYNVLHVYALVVIGGTMFCCCLPSIVDAQPDHCCYAFLYRC